MTFLQFSGYGDGNGEGMGQWGAYGYASEFGWDYEQILAHYYGGTTLGRLGPPEPDVTVQLSELQGKNVVVEAVAGGRLSASWPGGPRMAAAALEVARKQGAEVVSSAASCAGPWHEVARLGPTVGVTLAASAPARTEVCLAGTPWRAYQGELVVRPDGETDNVVGLEDYVDGVVPAESPASWAQAGGEAALEAQAVAARSYAVAMMRSTGQICDTAACQVYAGVQRGLTADAAVAATRGLVLYCAAASSCGPAGSVALAEYSASTGGYSAGGAFPAVPDLGDSLPANPVHSWSLKVPLSYLARHFGPLGPPESVHVVKRNGLGALGGRALLVVVVGKRGSLTLSGARFAGLLGLPSDWFRVGAPAGRAASTSPATAPPASTTTPDRTAPATTAPATTAPATTAPATTAPAG